MEQMTATSLQGLTPVRWIPAMAFILFTLALASSVPPSAPANGDMGQILADLETFAEAERVAGHVPGMAYAVVHDGEVVYAKGFGETCLESGRRPDERTLFEIGSCTKAFNAALLGTLVDEGKVRWTDFVTYHLPKFKMMDPWVTQQFQVRDLVAQHSGMPSYAIDAMSTLGFGREDIMRAIRFVEPTSSFRSEYGYQNNLHLWAADLIENKTGLTWEEVMRRRLLGPMGMADSTLDPAVNDADPNHAMGHLWNGSNLQVIPSDWPYRSWLTIYAPAGGLYSNVRDMSRWLLFQLGDGEFDGTRIFTAHAAKAMREPRILAGTVPPTTSFLYCSGWIFQTASPSPYWWHNGGTIGMHSIVAYYPEGHLGLVVLTNEPANHVPEHMATRLHELYFGSTPTQGTAEAMAALADRPRLPSAKPLPESSAARPLRHYTGSYSNPAYGRAIVKKEGNALVMSLGPSRVTGPLVPTGGDTFRFDFPAWPGNSRQIEFRGHASGKAARLTVEGFTDVRGGAFTRVGD